MDKRNSLYFMNWVTYGILHVKDLFHERGNLKSLSEFSNSVDVDV